MKIDFENSFLHFETDAPLSEVIPILNNFGLIVLKEESSKYFIKKDILPLLKEHQKSFTEVLILTLAKQNPSCKLLSLSLTEGFNLREINLFRTIMRYENQLVLEFNILKIVDALTKHHKLSKKLLEFFYKKADKKDVEELFKEISDSDEDRVLKLFFEIVKNITKTNFFLNKPAISIKIETKNLKSFLRGIQPNIEMFVFHKDFSGIHLRMSKVARGGIRYSSRYDDFRVEIKSLMATQEGKNAIIIPSGAKGGFVIRKKPLSKDDFVKIYRMYIDSLLDLIDDEDNYFVVAADKGTSNMSDEANDIALKRGYWLGDAFASGGSRGYSHKKMGITAKGALKSVHRYFIERGIDFYKTPIRVVGIGSMGGDVFGNGLLQSENFLLVGAISHNEIFVDPNPDKKRAYKERKRLFNSKAHKWSDFDKSILSEGGFVIKRNQKDIKLSLLSKKFLKIKKDVVDAEEIAIALLKLDVDMIYNGGVGTYFKASTQTNLEVGDKENEYVRIDANLIKAKAVCEGGNLGFTQKARYEYALNGGFINLDSIDNSAGVNTSDHEVNLKILLSGVKNKDEVLLSLKPWVENTVLWDNYFQSLSISLDRLRSKENLKRFIKTIHILENSLEVFERRFFSLPNDKQIELVIDDEEMLIRPALAVLLLYAKIFLKDLLNKSSMIDDEPFFKRYLFKYFPKDFKLLYEDEILSHPLKREIISMIIANKIINYQGASFVYDYQILGEKKFLQKIKAYLMTNQLFDLNDNRYEIYRKDFKEDVKKQYQELLKIEKEMESNVKWLLQNFNESELNFEFLLSFKDKIDKKSLDIASYKFVLASIKVQKLTNKPFDFCMKVVNKLIDIFFITLLLEKLDEIIVKDSNKELLKTQLEQMLGNFVVKIVKDTIVNLSENDNIKESLIDYVKSKEFDLQDYQNRIDELKQNDSFSIYQIAVLVNSLVLI
jgi:glutamate dehydrogenase